MLCMWRGCSGWGVRKDWSQDTDPVHLLNGWLTLKLGPAWRVEPLKDRAMASTFVCRGLGMPGEWFPDSALWWLEQCWPHRRALSAVQRQRTGRPFPTESAAFSESFFVCFFLSYQRDQMQSIGCRRAQDTSGISAESAQRKEEGRPYTDGWSILEPVMWMLSEVLTVENLRKKSQSILEYCLELGNHYLKFRVRHFPQADWPTPAPLSQVHHMVLLPYLGCWLPCPSLDAEPSLPVPTPASPMMPFTVSSLTAPVNCALHHRVCALPGAPKRRAASLRVLVHLTHGTPPHGDRAFHGHDI